MTVEQAQQALYAAMAAASTGLTTRLQAAEATYVAALQTAATNLKNSTDGNRFNQYILDFNTATMIRDDALEEARVQYERDVSDARQDLASAMGEAYAAHDRQKQYTTPQASVDQPVNGDDFHGPG